MFLHPPYTSNVQQLQTQLVGSFIYSIFVFLVEDHHPQK